jgi:hypothetical protein
VEIIGSFPHLHQTAVCPDPEPDQFSLLPPSHFLKIHFNPLNAELNPIFHLLVLLRDLTFMGPCIVNIFQYIFNKMQRYTVYLYLEAALHVSVVLNPLSGAHTTVSTASGICHTVTAICRFHGRVGTV